MTTCDRIWAEVGPCRRMSWLRKTGMMRLARDEESSCKKKIAAAAKSWLKS